MKLSSNSRHLEVQLLADEYGNAVALNGRDCSVQRRHQKIIEEGPPVAASPDVWTEMEKAAVALAQAVGYANAGTVEYLYNEIEQKFYFLELNPRLQVEHPVTEMITKVNIPAAQLQVAMGIPLYHIPDIRELYGKHRFETPSPSSIIDFDVAERAAPFGHCIAVRIPGAWRSKQKQLRLKYKKLYDFVQNATDEPIDAAKRIDAVWNSLGFVSGKFTDLETLTSKENAATLADEDQLKVSFHNIRNQRCSKEKMNRKRKKEVSG
jgi:hypothetical protein